MNCTYHRGNRHRCHRVAVAVTPEGAPTCGQHERQRAPRTGLGALPFVYHKRFALDLVDVWHVVGSGDVSFDDWLRVFYPGQVGRTQATRRAWDRFLRNVRALGFTDSRMRMSPGRVRIDMPRAMAWAQAALGEEAGVPHRRAYGINVPSDDEIAQGRGYQSLSDWSHVLPLGGVSSQVLQVLASQQVPMTVAQLALEVRHGNRSHVVVGPHAAKRPPCRLCVVDHGLRQHHHKIDGPRRTVYGPVRDKVAAVRRSLNELETLGFVKKESGRRFVVTVTGYEAAVAERQLGVEAAGAAYDPERDYEAAMARRAPAPVDMSFDFGANPLPPVECRGCNKAWATVPKGARVLAESPGYVQVKCKDCAYAERFRASGGDEAAHYRAGNPMGALAIVGAGNPCCGGCAHGRACLRQNPMGALAIIGAGNPPRYRANPTDGKRRGDRHHAGTVTVESARDYWSRMGRLPEFEAALRAYVAFHGVEPHGVELYRVPSRGGKTTREIGAALGRVPQTRYRSSNNGGTKDEADTWVHDHPRGGEPLEVLFPRTGLTTKVGGTFKITDWWRD